MQKAVPVGDGGMIAVLGTKISEINDLLKSHNQNSGVCEIANDNAEGQVILSGDKKSINKKFSAFSGRIYIFEWCIPIIEKRKITICRLTHFSVALIFSKARFVRIPCKL